MTTIRMNKLEDLETIIPEQNEKYPGFYFYPEDKRISVSKEGIILNNKTGKILKCHFNQKTKSPTFIITSPGEKAKSHRLCRVIARTFIGRPSRHLDKEYTDLEVNHVDGCRENNTLDNLEWITGKENVIHAHLSNFHPSDRMVLAKNVITGEIRKFVSSKQCSDIFEIHRATFWKHLNTSSGKYHKSGFIFKWDDGTDWLNLPLNQLKEIGRVNKPVDVLFKNTDNLITHIFDNIKIAAQYFNISAVTLWRHLKHHGFYKIPDGTFILNNPSNDDIDLVSDEIVTV